MKVVTGLRRCGKPFRLFTLYHEYLNGIGVPDDHIVEVALDDAENFIYHNPRRLLKYLKSRIGDKDQYYIFIDEIQFVKKIKIRDPEIGNSAPITFYSVVNALLKQANVDVYVTGSNSTMLSKDVMTEFRGRGGEVRVRPLSFLEFMSVYEGDARDGWDEYLECGGMPLAVLAKGHAAKSNYLVAGVIDFMLSPEKVLSQLLQVKFASEMTRIADIVDNRAAEGFVSEHGLSPLTEDGALVTGCCHAGIMNAAQTFRHAVPHIVIRTIVGGLHLCHATDDAVVRTGDFLRQRNLDRLVLLHCTGEAAGAKLTEMLSCPVVRGAAGSVLVEAWNIPSFCPPKATDPLISLGSVRFFMFRQVEKWFHS